MNNFHVRWQHRLSSATIPCSLSTLGAHIFTDFLLSLALSGENTEMAVKARSIGHFPVDLLHQVEAAHQNGRKNMLIVSVFVESLTVYTRPVCL
jgi:hypothetical protein